MYTATRPIKRQIKREKIKKIFFRFETGIYEIYSFYLTIGNPCPSIEMIRAINYSPRLRRIL